MQEIEINAETLMPYLVNKRTGRCQMISQCVRMRLHKQLQAMFSTNAAQDTQAIRVITPFSHVHLHAGT
ncbi:hypothetical protein D3C85_1906900 [compost metagenome]